MAARPVVQYLTIPFLETVYAPQRETSRRPAKPLPLGHFIRTDNNCFCSDSDDWSHNRTSYRHKRRRDSKRECDSDLAGNRDNIQIDYRPDWQLSIQSASAGHIATALFLPGFQVWRAGR